MCFESVRRCFVFALFNKQHPIYYTLANSSECLFTVSDAILLWGQTQEKCQKKYGQN